MEESGVVSRGKSSCASQLSDYLVVVYELDQMLLVRYVSVLLTREAPHGLHGKLVRYRRANDLSASVESGADNSGSWGCCSERGGFGMDLDMRKSNLAVFVETFAGVRR